MNTSTRAKALIGAVAIGGAIAAMGGAYTAGGLDGTSGLAARDTFVGGQVTKTVDGAVLDTIDYVFDATDPNKVTQVNVKYAAAETGASTKLDLKDGGTPTPASLIGGPVTCTTSDGGTNWACDIATPVAASTIVSVMITAGQA